MRTTRKAGRIVALTVGAGILLSGCTVEVANPFVAPSIPDQQTQKSAPKAAGVVDEKKVAADAAPSAPATPAPVATAAAVPMVPVRGDLDNGSTTRFAKGSTVDLTVDYWMAPGAGTWKPGDLKTVNLAAKVDERTGVTRKIYLSRFQATTVIDGKNVVLADDKSTSDPGYLASKPYSYNGVFSLGATPADVRVVQVAVQYDLLVPTSAKSKDYVKETISDTLVLQVHPS